MRCTFLTISAEDGSPVKRMLNEPFRPGPPTTSAPCKLTVARNRALDALAIAAAQRAGRMPWQQGLDLLALGRLSANRIHGQPLSIPAAFSSSASLLRA